MKRQKIDWRHRKKILAGDPVIPLPCGCKKWADTGEKIQWCDEHAPKPREESGEKGGVSG